MTTQITIDKFFQDNFNFLCVYGTDEESEILKDAYCNIVGINEDYVETYENILQAASSNVNMVFADRQDGQLVARLRPEGVGKVEMKILKPDEMVKKHPEFVIDEEY